MSFDLPVAIAPKIRAFAQAEHISEYEAIVRLIESGLSIQSEGNPTGINGEKLSPKDFIESSKRHILNDQPISAEEFFQQIQATTGFQSKAEAHAHLEAERNSWS